MELGSTKLQGEIDKVDETVRAMDQENKELQKKAQVR